MVDPARDRSGATAVTTPRLAVVLAGALAVDVVVALAAVWLGAAEFVVLAPALGALAAYARLRRDGAVARPARRALVVLALLAAATYAVLLVAALAAIPDGFGTF